MAALVALVTKAPTTALLVVVLVMLVQDRVQLPEAPFCKGARCSSVLLSC